MEPITNITDYRIQIGVEIILDMQKNGDLPKPNKFQLAKTMQERYKRMEYDSQLSEAGYRWRPSVGYWQHHLSGIQEELKTRGKYLAYSHNGNDSFRGQWQFCNMREHIDVLKREHADLATRIENYNNATGRPVWNL